jgi:hypothetical protein
VEIDYKINGGISMLSKEIKIYVSFHSDEENLVFPELEKIRMAGWKNITHYGKYTNKAQIIESIKQSGIILIFLSKNFAYDDSLMLEEFAYIATILRKPFIPIWLDSLADIKQDYLNKKCDRQLLSALEMLTAKYFGTTTDELISALENFLTSDMPYKASIPQICEKPCEAYEGNEPYIFISYAHDDAPQIYPVIKKIYEFGWDLWYDEGIKTTERYLLVIAHHIKCCSVFVLMLTNRCLERPFIMNFELEYARRLEIPIIPVLLEELNSQPWSIENASLLKKTAIMPNVLFDSIDAIKLPNKGKRIAVPPAIKQNVVYDVVLPPELPGFEYSVQNDKITITKYVGNDSEVIIPSTLKAHDGNFSFRVVAIGGSAFANCELLTSITIPEGVTSIKNWAFSGCKSLVNVSIPKGVTSISFSVFSDCKSLKNLILPDSCMSIDREAEFNAWCYVNEDCPQLDIVFNVSRTTIFYYSENNTATHFTIPNSVTRIGDEAFYDCKSLISITIPEGVTSIGNRAFCGCESLISINIPESVTSIGEDAFDGCESLISVIIPESVTSISKDTYLEADRLNLGLANSTQTLDQSTQDNNNHFCIPQSQETPRALICCAEDDVQYMSELLTELYWEGFNFYYEIMIDQQAIKKSQCILAIFSKYTVKCERTLNILKEAIKYETSKIIQVFIEDCTNMPDELQNKLQYRQAIYQSRYLKQDFMGLIRDSLRQFGCVLGHPRGFDVQNIGNSAEVKKFHPTGFSHVIIPKTFFDAQLPVTSIGDFAFYLCDSLISITIPDAVTSIGRCAFCNCWSLTNFIIPSGVTNIGEGVFNNCSSLTSIMIPDGVTSIGKDTFNGCHSLTSVNIPNSATSIDESTFAFCYSLTNIIIPNGVTSIGKDAFFNCRSLISITIPYHVIIIGESAFYNCRSLADIVIPKSVMSIGKACFADCSYLKNITILNKDTIIGEDAFNNCKSLTIHCHLDSRVWEYAEEYDISHKPLKQDKLFNQEACNIEENNMKIFYTKGE